MYMYKVRFLDANTNIPRAIKIYARNPYEACAKARSMRGGYSFRATQVNNDDEYVRIPVALHD